ncbi:MAG: hypothetical protein CMF70_01215 [Magnetovibrio sp.]|nr:hypothetical protein [Magnetovibrio sp.]
MASPGEVQAQRVEGGSGIGAEKHHAQVDAQGHRQDKVDPLAPQGNGNPRGKANAQKGESFAESAIEARRRIHCRASEMCI